MFHFSIIGLRFSFLVSPKILNLICIVFYFGLSFIHVIGLRVIGLYVFHSGYCSNPASDVAWSRIASESRLLLRVIR